ncbi:hypothetical protein Tco_1503774 [Tanacetum coccineum]
MYETIQTTIPFPSHLNRKEKDPGSFTLPCFINNVCFDNALADLGASTFFNSNMPEDVNVAVILGRPFLSTAHAKIDVFERKITLRVGEERIVFKSVKPASNFAVLEDMDAYRDEEMGDVIFGEPFLREVGIKARRFDGMITIYNGNESVTYQMVRSHLRFDETKEQKNETRRTNSALWDSRRLIEDLIQCSQTTINAD